MRPVHAALLLLSLTLGTVCRAHAQAVTGVLAGRVLSSEGEPLEGVRISVAGARLQGERDVGTDDRGRFVMLGLPAGMYSVSLQRIGHTPLRVTDVAVVLGGTTSLGEVRLPPQAVELAEIVVSGARPFIDITTASAVTVLDSSVFLSLPTGRDFRSVVPLVPQATQSPYGDGVNVAGATGLENAYFVDGIHVTDPFNADGSVNLPYNFVREVQVATGGYEAEFGRGQGGVVSVITHSGGNEVYGRGVGFFTSDELRTTSRWGVGQSQVENFSSYDFGFDIGGPIRRDRLWFYAAYNPAFESADVALPGITPHRDSRTGHLFAGKLTGRVGTATDFTLTVFGDPRRRDFVGASLPIFPLPASVSDPRVVLGKLSEGGTAVALQARHRIGRRVVVAASLARLDRRRDNTPRAGPLSDPAAAARLDDHVLNVAAGNYGLSETNQTARTASQASASVFAGAHTIKLGAEYEGNSIEYDALFSFVSRDLSTDSAGLPDTIYGWFQSTQRSRAHNRVVTLYAQDSWEVSRRLRLNVGVRWEGQFVAGDTGTARSITNQVAPRFGVVFQPGELGAQKLYASIGRFYEEIPLLVVHVWVGTFSQTFGIYPQNPLVDTSGGSVQGGTQVGETPDRDLRGQYYDEVIAGYERRLGKTYRIGLRGTYRTLRWALEDGATDPASPFISGNPGRGALAYLPRARRDYSALELILERAGTGPLTFLASYVVSRNRGNYTGLFATDLLAPGANAGPQFDFPEQTVNATGLLPNDRTHVLKVFGSYRLARSFTVGASAVVATGTPLSEYGTGPFFPYWTFIRPRGTAGRTPTTWNVDLRFAYELPVTPGARVRPVILLDVFNIANQRRALTYDQLHYTTPDQSGLNPNYLSVTRYQTPLSARVGLLLNF